MAPARFIFKLQPVLEHRLRTERRRQQELGQVERRRVEIEQNMRLIHEEVISARHRQREALAGAGGGGVRLADARLDANAALSGMVRLQRAAAQFGAVRREQEAARLRLLEAARARKAVEVLRERRYREWLRERAKREAAALDELQTMRACRKGELS